MFCVVYEFKVKTGMNAQFEKSWSDFTEAIFEVAGSLGSRLHKTADPQHYVAYAQWPSADFFDQARPENLYSTAQLEMRTSMRETIAEMKTVYRLEMIDDHLR